MRMNEMERTKAESFNRTDRSPTSHISFRPSPIPKQMQGLTMSSSDSSFSSTFFSSSLGASAAAPPPAAGAAPPAAGAPPPAPTLERSSLMFLPSSAFARSEAQIGSSSTPAALVRATILSDWIDVGIEGERREWRIRSSWEMWDGGRDVR
jgi:hypothetical protein